MVWQALEMVVSRVERPVSFAEDTLDCFIVAIKWVPSVVWPRASQLFTLSITMYLFFLVKWQIMFHCLLLFFFFHSHQRIFLFYWLLGFTLSGVCLSAGVLWWWLLCSTAFPWILIRLSILATKPNDCTFKFFSQLTGLFFVHVLVCSLKIFITFSIDIFTDLGMVKQDLLSFKILSFRLRLIVFQTLIKNRVVVVSLVLA